jgi:predicted nucleic acid-binding protein
VAGSILDSSVLIELWDRPNPIVDRAIAAGEAEIPPLVVAELVTGATELTQRERIGLLLQEVPLYETDLGHWINVGLLRQHLRRHGLTVTLPDAHIAQCAIERHAALITRDAVFARIADHTQLRVITA